MLRPTPIVSSGRPDGVSLHQVLQLTADLFLVPSILLLDLANEVVQVTLRLGEVVVS